MAVTGFTRAQFEKLLVLFTQSYFELFGQTVAQRQAEIVVTPSLASEEELLFFTLFSLKAGLTYDALGFGSGMEETQASAFCASASAPVGKTQDYGMFKLEFPPGQPWFADLTVRLDLGFFGFEKDYECKKLYLPHKKPKKQELANA